MFISAEKCQEEQLKNIFMLTLLIGSRLTLAIVQQPTVLVIKNFVKLEICQTTVIHSSSQQI